MRRRPGLLLISLASACQLAPYTDSASEASSSASSSGTTTEASTGTSTETSTPTTSGTTGDSSWQEGCDVLLYGDQHDTTAVQAALDGAADNTTICFVGDFALGPVSASGKAGLTLRSASPNALKGADLGGGPVPAVLDFANSGGLVLSDMTDLSVDLLTVRNPGSHGVRVENSTRVRLEDIHVSWDGPPGMAGGLFGVYATGSSQVLFLKCDVSGASDAGIFAGDSSDIVMRDNHASGNVTGLQVEDSERAEIFDNVSEHNALGIFVVGLPIAASTAGGVLVHDNEVRDNDGQNFAPDPVIASNIPAGIGVMVLAMDAVEVRNNLVTGNHSTGVIVVSFDTVALLSPMPIEAVEGFDAYAETVDLHDNQLADNGLMPADLFAAIFMLDPMTDLAWDGVIDPNKDNADGHLNLCIRNNGDADFVDLDALNFGENKSFDLAPHDCAHPPVPAVQLPF